MYIMTKFNKNSFEFIFTSLVDDKPNSKMFLTVQSIFRSYDTTRLYRDLKLRGAITRDKDLILLPHEQVYSKIQGVWNLSSDQGIYKEIQSLHQVFSVSPIFGVDYKLDEQEGAAEKKPVVTETVQIDDSHSNVDAFAVYFTDGAKKVDREPVFDPQIGLAVEKLPDGATMSKLWTIVATAPDEKGPKGS